MIKKSLLLLLAGLLLSPVWAVIDSYPFSDPGQEQRFYRLTQQLRCPKCQNQAIAESNAPIARDLRGEVYRLLQEGADDQQILDFMLERYGYFVLYSPPLQASTLVLWLGPLVLLLLGLLVLVQVVRRHRGGTDPLSEGADDTEEAGGRKAP